MTVRLTPQQKNVIRDMPCGKCGSEPPFGDGTRCHTHRPVPARGYVHGNVVPRCPDCHAKEPGHPAMTAMTAKAHAALSKRIRREGMTPLERERQRNSGRAGGYARARKLGADQLSDIGRKAGLASKERRRHNGLTAKELARNRRNAEIIARTMTAEQRSEINRKAWKTRRANAERQG